MLKNDPLHFVLLLPCYNNAAGLVQSLNSIYYHPLNYLVVIVDDGSTEPLNLTAIQAGLNRRQPLHLIQHRHNRGITHALNTGLNWILTHTNAPYIARLDCSDICHPQRFYQQVAFLDNHLPITLLGSWCYFQSADESIHYRYTTPTGDAAIKKAMHLRNVFIHPTVMFRTSILKRAGLYPDAYAHAEDYALFWKMLHIGAGAIIDQYLVTCAVNTKGISATNRRAQLRSRQRVITDFGTNYLLKIIGICKLQLLMLVPQALLLKFKKD